MTEAQRGRSDTRLMSDAALERLTSGSIEDFYWKGKLNRSDVLRWIEQVRADSGRVYEPVYRPRRVRGKLDDSLWLRRREEMESTAHARKKTTKSPAQLQREIDEALARPAGKSAAVIVYSRPSGYWYAQALDPSGKRISDATGYSRDDVLRALRGQYKMMGVTITSVKDEDPYATPTSPQHAAKRGARYKGPPVVGSHGLGTADVRTEQGAYWIVTGPTGYRVDYKPWGPSNEVDLGMFPSRRRAREKIAEHALSVGATVRHHATKKQKKQILEPLPHNRQWHNYIVGQGGELVARYKGTDIHRNGIAYYVNGFYVGTSMARAKEYVRDNTAQS